MKSIFDDLELSLNTPGDISFFVCTYNDGYDIYFVISMEIILECFMNAVIKGLINKKRVNTRNKSRSWYRLRI